MTVPVLPERSTVSVSLRHRVRAALAVMLARGLVTLPPARLRAVLQFATRGASSANAELALNARNAVIAVSKRCAAQRCVERAIATALLCRTRGAWPDWCTGVKTNPFRAHAWVEVDGEAVGERDDITPYRKIMVVSPRH